MTRYWKIISSNVMQNLPPHVHPSVRFFDRMENRKQQSWSKVSYKKIQTKQQKPPEHFYSLDRTAVVGAGAKQLEMGFPTTVQLLSIQHKTALHFLFLLFIPYIHPSLPSPSLLLFHSSCCREGKTTT